MKVSLHEWPTLNFDVTLFKLFTLLNQKAAMYNKYECNYCPESKRKLVHKIKAELYSCFIELYRIFVFYACFVIYNIDSLFWHYSIKWTE